MARRLKFSYRKNYERKKERLKRLERKAAKALSQPLTTEKKGGYEESTGLVNTCEPSHQEQPSPHTQVVWWQHPFTGTNTTLISQCIPAISKNNAIAASPDS